MNRVRPGRFCYVCGEDIAALVIAARTPGPGRSLSEIASLAFASREEVVDAVQRQTFSGMDDLCQQKRQAAAIAYEKACEQVRTMLALGATIGERGHRPLKTVMDAAAAAEARCVALKMWPATR